MLKQVILVRKDLKLSKGKMAAQVSHASVESALRGDKDKMKTWRSGMKKSVLAVENLNQLFEYKQKLDSAGFTTALITDAGHTHLEPGTITCLGVGPDDEEKLDAITGDLKLIS